MGLLEGMPIEITRQQQLIRKELLKTDADNIKVQRQMTSLVQGAITKRIVCDSGKCTPLPVCGNVEVPEPKVYDCAWKQYQKIEQME